MEFMRLIGRLPVSWASWCTLLQNVVPWLETWASWQCRLARRVRPWGAAVWSRGPWNNRRLGPLWVSCTEIIEVIQNIRRCYQHIAQSSLKGGLGGGSGSLCFDSRASAPPRGLLVSEHRGVTTLRRHDRVGAWCIWMLCATHLQKPISFWKCVTDTIKYFVLSDTSAQFTEK